MCRFRDWCILTFRRIETAGRIPLPCECKATRHLKIWLEAEGCTCTTKTFSEYDKGRFSHRCLWQISEFLVWVWGKELEFKTKNIGLFLLFISCSIGGWKLLRFLTFVSSTSVSQGANLINPASAQSFFYRQLFT